jgi:hypothetical protein
MLSALRTARRMPCQMRGCSPGRAWHDVASIGRLGDAACTESVPKPLRTYLRLLYQQPRTTVAVVSVLTAGMGDALAQLSWTLGLRIRGAAIGDESAYGRGGAALAAVAAQAVPATREGASPEMGVQRTVRFALLAGGFVGVVGESWFRFLLSVAPGYTYEVAVRAVFDQVRTWRPFSVSRFRWDRTPHIASVSVAAWQVLFAPVALGLVVAGTTALATGDPDYVRHKLRDGWHACGKMWGWWLAGSATSYMLVPPPWQPPFAAGLSLLWLAYISARTHRPTVGATRKSEDLERVRDFLRDRRAEDARAG